MKILCKKDFIGRWVKFNSGNFYSLADTLCTKYNYMVADENGCAYSFLIGHSVLPILDDDYYFNEFFYTPEETKNIMRTELIERMIDE